jgi:hypothetical protein
MLCLYNPYSSNLASGGGRADPVRGIFRTVWSAWANTRSMGRLMLAPGAVLRPRLGLRCGGGGGDKGEQVCIITHK